jgi:hypothetical protein
MVAGATAALADAIDGKWCDGTRQITIDGPKIMLPSGNSYQGNYTRHTFDFTIPDSEEGAGEQLRMVVQSDELMHLQRRPKGTQQAGPIEAWRRCANIS